MGRLALIWDGVWLTWTTFDSSQSVGRREISRQDMIPEVLRALRNQVGPGHRCATRNGPGPQVRFPWRCFPTTPRKNLGSRFMPCTMAACLLDRF